MTPELDPLAKPEKEDEKFQENKENKEEPKARVNTSAPVNDGNLNKTKAVNFFFFADTEVDAKALVEYLREHNFGRGINIFRSEDRYSIIGYTDKELMKSQPFEKWILQMNELAYHLDCEFDGWGNVV